MTEGATHPGRRPTANPGDAHASELVGIKRQDWRAQSEAALNLGRKLASRDEIAYCVVSEDPPRLQPKAPICVRTLGNGSVCARPNCSTAAAVS